MLTQLCSRCLTSPLSSLLCVYPCSNIFDIFDLKLLNPFLQTQCQFLLWRDKGSGVKHKCNILRVIYYLTKEVNCSELGFNMATNSSVSSILIFFLIYFICSGLICQHLLPVSQKVLHGWILFCIIFWSLLFPAEACWSFWHTFFFRLFSESRMNARYSAHTEKTRKLSLVCLKWMICL